IRADPSASVRISPLPHCRSQRERGQCAAETGTVQVPASPVGTSAPTAGASFKAKGGSFFPHDSHQPLATSDGGTCTEQNGQVTAIIVATQQYAVQFSPIVLFRDQSPGRRARRCGCERSLPAATRRS